MIVQKQDKGDDPGITLTGLALLNHPQSFLLAHH
jgi:hypothetical protein